MTAIVPLQNIELGRDPATAAGGPQGPAVPASIRGGVITIGNFDGVHRGHAHLLGQVRALADQRGGPAVAVVLDPHPASILRPEVAPERLTWIERRAELMDTHKVDALVVCRTTPQFLRMTPTEFFQSLVVDRLQAGAIVEGPNFYFGRDRAGDIGVLRKLCNDHEIDLQIAEPVSSDEQLISSTRIRNLLEVGDVGQASELLGAKYRIRGTVGSGDKRGREIGFPTANLSEIDVVVPAAGVYGGIAFVQTGAAGGAGLDRYLAAIHIGPTPTFESDGEARVEAHLLDFDGDLYGQTLLLDFAARVRDIARFDSAQRLVEQLEQDVKTIRSQLARPR